MKHVMDRIFGKPFAEGLFNIKVDQIYSPYVGSFTIFHLECGRVGFYYPDNRHILKIGHCYIIKGEVIHPSNLQRKHYAFHILGSRRNVSDIPKTRILNVEIIKSLGKI